MQYFKSLEKNYEDQQEKGREKRLYTHRAEWSDRTVQWRNENPFEQKEDLEKWKEQINKAAKAGEDAGMSLGDLEQ
jgi:hypothetical protein